MISDRNIVCIASNWWYDPTSKHHVMKVLAERNHVIWVNYHGSRRPEATAADLRAAVGKLRQVVQGPRRVAENMTVITPLVAPLPGSRAVAALNRRLLVRQIRSVLRGLPSRPVQVWTFAPDVDYLAGQFNEDALVYYCVDDFSEFTGYDREAVLVAEGRLCGKADLIVTTSERLRQLKRSNYPDKTVLVTHGVDVEHFAKVLVEPAPELSSILQPIIGFWGLIQDWVDLELIGAIAAGRPDWSIVLIGEALADVGPLRGLRNVHLLGRRPYSSLPAYAHGFDIGLIPFRMNALTRAVNPIKLREYLAAGLPVVSAPLPEVERYSHWVRTAEGIEHWIAAISDAMLEDSEAVRSARREAMKSETWAAKVREIERHLALAIAPVA